MPSAFNYVLFFVPELVGVVLLYLYLELSVVTVEVSIDCVDFLFF